MVINEDKKGDVRGRIKGELGKEIEEELPTNRLWETNTKIHYGK